MDTGLVHRWHACFRRYGARTVVDVTYEPAPASLTPGIDDLVYLDALDG